MSTDRQHHSSKKNQYTLVLVPNEDTTRSRNLHLKPWQLFGGLILMILFMAALILVGLTYTPLGELFPLSNRGLENKYNKELISINQQMNNLMEQLVELRAYNIKLRKALGENIILTDSGTVKELPLNAENARSNIKSDGMQGLKTVQIVESEARPVPTQAMILESDIRLPISFPAIVPTEGYVTRGFDPAQNHIGIDIAGKTGNIIVAAADGHVVFAGWTYNDGYVVILSHANGFMSFYKHNQSYLKSAGSFVRRGEAIATLGSSGKTSSGPHLHFEIWKDGSPVNPSTYLINN